MDAAARSVGRMNGHRSFLDRVFGRTRPARDIIAEDLRDRGEDVWRGLRL
jgi:hypothetical protein